MTKKNTDDALINTVLGDYTIKRLIAQGGMGKVYEAQDNQLKRKVAVKVITLKEEYAHDMMTRFRREAEAISRLDNHPNIVTVYRFGEQDGVHYMAMQLVKGQSLAEYSEELRQAGKTLSHSELLHIFKQVAAALDYAHEQGVIHRDVKPANIMLEPDPKFGKRAILMDFGLVMQVDTSSTMGMAFGTPRYIAPEQAMSSQQAVPQSDLYSMGVIIYELLAGRPPFGVEETAMSVALSHITKPPPPLSDFRPDLPKAVVKAVMKTLEKSPENRYKTAIEFIRALEAGFADKLSPAGSPPTLPNRPSTIAMIMEELQGQDSNKGAPAAAGKRRRVSLMALVAVLLLGALVGLFQLGFFEGNNAASGPPPPTDGEPDLQLFYADGNLAIYNTTDMTLNLQNLELRRDDSSLPLADFGRTRLQNWEAGVCSYITTDRDSIERPEPCRPQREYFPLVYTSPQDFVWVAAEGADNSFRVYQNDHLLATCRISEGLCGIDGIQRP